MGEEQKTALQRATDFANSGNYSEALEISRSILVAEPTNGDAKLIEAISLSQLGNVRDASEAFSDAIELDPTNPRIRFNAAVHELNSGSTEQARAYAQATIDLDSSHQGAKDLLARLPEAPNFATFGSIYPREKAVEFEPEYGGIPLIEKLGPAWMGIGIFLGMLSLGLFIWTFVLVVPQFSAFMDAVSSQDQTKMKSIMGVLGSPVLQILGWVGPVANLIWMIMDVLHRRRGYFWLIGHIPCSCVGAGFVTQFAYMIFGRK